MPRALKTFITNLGFFELAIAAPSMKAALEAWGMSHNAFQHGFAKQTDDPKIVAASTAQPGVVLKRAVGSSGEFREHAELPKSLPNKKLPKAEAAKPRQRTPSKTKPTKKANRADIVSFEKARVNREKKLAAEEARVKKERAMRQRATDIAESALDAAREQYEKAMALIEAGQKRLDRRTKKERDRWDAEQERLKAVLKRARNGS
jgi:colicin import membrane protein